MFERFTDRARRVVVLAQEEARMLNHNYIGTEHILLGLVHEGEGIASKALLSLNVSLDAVRRQVEEVIGRGGSPPGGHIPFTPRAKKVLELSLREALQLGHNYIGTEHILLGVIREGEGVGAQVLTKLGANLERVRQAVIHLLPASGAESPVLAEFQADMASTLARVVERGRRTRELAERLAGLLAEAMDDPTVTADLVLSGLPPNSDHLQTLEALFGEQEEELLAAMTELELRRRRQAGEGSGAESEAPPQT